jgi:hypothetical protein
MASLRLFTSLKEKYVVFGCVMTTLDVFSEDGGIKVFFQQ